MKNTVLLLAVLFFFLLATTVNAQVSISCPSCYINNCQCSVANCAGGTAKIYTTADCSGIPKYQYSFTSSSFTWNPSQTGDYYFKVLCSDENVSACIAVTVSSVQTTTTQPATTTQGGGGGGGSSSTTTTLIVNGTTTTQTTTISAIAKCNWTPPSPSVLGQCEAVVGWYYDAELKRCVALSGCEKPADMPFSTPDECKLACELAGVTTCDQECKNKWHDVGTCRSWGVVLEAKAGCEENETDIGETSDCYVSPGLMGVGRTCCCSGKRIITTTRYYLFVITGIIFVSAIVGAGIYLKKKEQLKKQGKFEKLKEKWT